MQDTTERIIARGEIEISGRRYVTAERLGSMLGITARTLSRWHSAGIGPPRTKIGKLVLYEVDKLPDWLAARETRPDQRPHQQKDIER